MRALQQAAGGQLDRCSIFGILQLRVHIHRGAQRQIHTYRHGQLGLVRARERISAGSQLAHRALQIGSAPIPALGARCAAYRDEAQLTFWQAEHHITRPILRNAHHRRAGADHLPHLSFYRHHDACTRGNQIRIPHLIARIGQLRLRLTHLRLSGLQSSLAPLQLRAADEVLIFQALKALEIRCSQITVRCCGRQCGARCIGG